MRVWIVIALLVCSGLTFALGQTPKVAGQIAPQAHLSNTETQASKNEERGTDERPLIIKNYPQITAKASAEAEEDRREKADADW